MLGDEIIESIDKSVLCWLATIDRYGVPNVSPKEVFAHWKNQHIIIANIASPGSVRNIEINPFVCVSFIDVLVQKGFKVKGKAKIIEERSASYDQMKTVLEQMTKGKYPFQQIIHVHVEKTEPIIAPSYWLFPEISEQQKIRDAKKKYGIVV